MKKEVYKVFLRIKLLMKLALYYIDFYITFLFELYFLVFRKSSKRSVVVVSQVVCLLPKLVQNDECKKRLR